MSHPVKWAVHHGMQDHETGSRRMRKRTRNRLTPLICSLAVSLLVLWDPPSRIGRSLTVRSFVTFARADKAGALAQLRETDPKYADCEIKNDLEIAYVVDASSSMIQMNEIIKRALPSFLRELQSWNPRIKASVR